ncbi:MAG TPA: molybdopterin-binding protein, partial [Gemmatimonadaceae bacterium]|nr:molybdopterin-binding protein [Gemmatimonadaceae bacterium]
MRVAVITVSDSVARGERQDASGAMISGWAKARNHEVVSAVSCADETVDIVRAIARAADTE